MEGRSFEEGDYEVFMKEYYVYIHRVEDEHEVVVRIA